MGLIYETNVRPKIGRTVVSTQNLEFINMEVFELAWTCVQHRELYNGSILFISIIFLNRQTKLFFFFFLSGI